MKFFFKHRSEAIMNSQIFDKCTTLSTLPQLLYTARYRVVQSKACLRFPPEAEVRT